MLKFISACAIAAYCLTPSTLLAAATLYAPNETETIAHGGGCRKSSPVGQCCHMEKAKGQVHCH
ncbi:hypothetical protein ACFSUD_05930 [Sulfitobacter aestuarii]|uniref:YHYH domain-containing protein n=1 Tax=Sulfitobacter aestuarii TaxID=2161676 RepID=A0ABW5TZK8_9RHOB